MDHEALRVVRNASVLCTLCKECPPHVNAVIGGEEVGVHWLGLSFSAGGHLVSVCASGGGVVRSDLVLGGEQS